MSRIHLHHSFPSYLCIHLRPQYRRHVRCKSSQDSSSNSAVPEDDLWRAAAFPHYLQKEQSDFCETLEHATAKELAKSSSRSKDSTLWANIRREAERDATAEPLLSSFLYASILSHDSFERSLSFVLSNRLSDMTLLATELFEVFHTILKNNPDMVDAAMADLWAIRERDPACASYSQALLYFKGYHAIQTHRIAHHLWHCGRRVMAIALQSKVSEAFAVDIHPAATIGKGVLLDHGTGIVIGETAEVGNNVSILQNVTLGGTGKQTGDRHPKVSDNVLIGASATILGNIRIGKGAQVAAGSLVLKPVPPKTMVAGSPAKEVGVVTGNPARNMEQWSRGVVADTLEEMKKRMNQEEECITNSSSNSVGSNSNGVKEVSSVVVDEMKKKETQSPPLHNNNGSSPPLSTGTDNNTEILEKESSEKEKKEVVSATNGLMPPPILPSDNTNSSSKKKSSANEEGRPGRPPAEREPVDAVTSDTAAVKKWGKAKKGGGDMEYMI